MRRRNGAKIFSALLTLFSVTVIIYLTKSFVGSSQNIDTDFSACVFIKRRWLGKTEIFRESLNVSSEWDIIWETFAGNKVYLKHRDSHISQSEYASFFQRDLELLRGSINARFRKTIPIYKFTFGHFRLSRVFGLEYRLYGHRISNKKRQPMEVRASKSIRHNSCVINARELPLSMTSMYVVVPYYNNAKRLAQFLSRHIWVTTTTNINIVFFISTLRGEKSLNEAETVSKETFGIAGYAKYVRVCLNSGDRFGDFSRSVAIRDAFAKIPEADALVLVSDVDVIFKKQFLQECQTNVIPGSQIYFPVIHGLYPYAHNRTGIRGKHGFWRFESYGMFCTRRQDFEEINAFHDAETRFSGWGNEDSFLYKRVIQSERFEPFRALSPNMFHVWHRPDCILQKGNEGACRAYMYGNLADRLLLGRALEKLLPNISVLIDELSK